MTPLDRAAYRDVVRQALAEDVGAGDITSTSTIPAERQATGTLVAKTDCVIAGLDIAREVFEQVDSSLQFRPLTRDGARHATGDRLATVRGAARAILTAERTALNFLQHLSGIATLTRRFVDVAAGKIAILDTRKTVPTLRVLAKYAVRCGGGTNHRAGLYDAVLIKENHAAAAGGIAGAVERVRSRHSSMPIEVETQSLGDVDEALAAGADVIMLDNLSTTDMRTAIARIDRRARVEISGGVTLARLPELAGLGADWISIGALTHSAPAADLSLEIEVRHG